MFVSRGQSHHYTPSVSSTRCWPISVIILILATKEGSDCLLIKLMVGWMNGLMEGWRQKGRECCLTKYLSFLADLRPTFSISLSPLLRRLDNAPTIFSNSYQPEASSRYKSLKLDFHANKVLNILFKNPLLLGIQFLELNNNCVVGHITRYVIKSIFYCPYFISLLFGFLKGL